MPATFRSSFACPTWCKANGVIELMSILAANRNESEHWQNVIPTELRNLVENIGLAITVWDDGLRLLASNKLAEELLQYPKGMLVPGAHFESFIRFHAARGEFGEGDVEVQVRKRVELAKRFEPHMFERERFDGVTLEICGTPLPGGGFFYTHLDVTERKQAEEALRKGLERFELALEVTGEGLWDWDIPSKKYWRSSRAADNFGFDKDTRDVKFDLEDPNDDWVASIHPEDRARALKSLRDSLELGTPYDAEYRFRLPSGKYRWIHSVGKSMCGPDGEPARMVGANRDISQRKDIEESLRNREERFRGILHLAHDAIILMDADTRITIWNNASERIFGYAANEAIGKPIHYFLVPEHASDAAQTRWSEFFKSEVGPIIGRTIEVMARRKNGEEFPIEMSLSALTDNGNWCAIGIIRDINERKLVERALRRSEAKLSEAQKISHTGNWELDLRSGVENWSDECFRIFGLEPTGKAQTYEIFSRMVHPDDRNRVVAAVNDAQYCDKKYDIDYRIIRPNGLVRYVNSRATVYRNEAGEPVRMLGTNQDITDRKLAENALLKVDQELRQVLAMRSATLNALPAHIALLGADGHINWVNKSWEQLSETGELDDPAHGVGRHYIDVCTAVAGVDAQLIPEVESKLNEVLSGSLDSFSIEYPFHLPQQPRWFRLMVNQTSGKTQRGVVAMHIDITAERIAADRLQRAEQSEALADLAGGIAHEVNNMLTPILSLTSLAMEGLPKDGKEHGYLEIAKEAAERTSDIVKGVLTFSHHEESEKLPIDIGQCAQEGITLLRTILPVDIRLSHHVQLVSGKVLANPTQIDQILLNLVKNSIDAIGQNPGKISVTLDQVYLAKRFATVNAELDAGSYARIRVTDTGCGMNEETARCIFRPFYTTKEIGRGTGLGLSIIHGIVRDHNGGITVSSRVGAGTDIEIYLPVMNTAD